MHDHHKDWINLNPQFLSSLSDLIIRNSEDRDKVWNFDKGYLNVLAVNFQKIRIII